MPRKVADTDTETLVGTDNVADAVPDADVHADPDGLESEAKTETLPDTEAIAEANVATDSEAEVAAEASAEVKASSAVEVDAEADTVKPVKAPKRPARQPRPKFYRFAPVDRLERERVLRDERYTDGSQDELTFIHIGKCGGYSVADALASSPEIQSRFRSVKRIHLRPPYYQSNARYLLVLRNPIDRLISAFAWRYEKVVVEKSREFQYPGEFEALTKYENLNNLAESLVRDGRLSNDAMRSMLEITHFRHDISYYLTGLLEHLSAEQIFGVFTQGNLGADIEEFLGVRDVGRQNVSADVLFEKNMSLSSVARENLKLIFARDYECIRSLNALYPLGDETMATLMA